MSEKHRGRIGRGALGVILSVIGYIVAPTVLIWFVEGVQNGQIVLTEVESLLHRAVYAGIPMIVLAFPASYYVKGDRNRFVWRTVKAVYSCFWIAYVLKFGDLSGIVNLVDETGSALVNVGAVGLLAVTVLFKLLKIPVFYGEYKDNREEFEEEWGGNASGPQQSEGSIRIGGRYD